MANLNTYLPFDLRMRRVLTYYTNATSWKDLQTKVCTVFREIGYQAEIEKVLNGARTQFEIDVFAESNTKYKY